MLKVVLVGYGELSQSLLLGILQSKHKAVGVFRWEKQRPNRLVAFFRDLFIPDRLTSLTRSENIYEVRAKYANSKKFAKEMAKLKPDVILVGSWGEVLKKETIKLPKVAFINCHPSLLPAHRGSNPYASVLKNGETRTGITFHLMSEKIDTGEILLQKEFEISDEDTGETIRNKCAFEAKNSVGELLDKLENAELIPQKQDEDQASYFPRLNPEEARIDWDTPAEKIHNQVRSMLPWIKSYTLHKETFLYIKSTKVIKLNKEAPFAGVIIDKDGTSMLISTADKDKGILAREIETYGFLSKLWSKRYVRKKIKKGDFLN